MATCTTKQIEETRYVLELTKDEAQALRDVLGHVSGHPKTSRRGLCDLVLKALESAGFKRYYLGDISPESGVHFKPTKESEIEAWLPKL